MGKICIPVNERMCVIREVQTSLVSRNFGVVKTMVHLKRFFYCPQMKHIVTKYVNGCMLCLNLSPIIEN
jgi:hypothetical protein